MATIEDFQRLDIRTGVITAVEDFPRARTPAYRVTVDFGPEIGMKRSSAQATNYGKEELIGMQVIGVVNLPPRNIAGFLSEVLDPRRPRRGWRARAPHAEPPRAHRRSRAIKGK